jgi:UDP-glucose 4-epimerase
MGGNVVLVTGATGRIGANLVKRLLEEGYEVRSLAMREDPLLGKLSQLKSRVVYGDLNDYESLANAVRGVDYVVHLAAIMGRPPGMSKQTYLEINVTGALNVLEASVRSGSVNKFLFSSTDATYPVVKPQYSPIDENHPQRPDSLYGFVKVAGERLCLEYATEYGMPVTILRYGCVLTPPELLTMILPSCIGFPSRLLGAEVEVRSSEGKSNQVKAKEVFHDKRLKVWKDQNGRSWKVHCSDVRDVVEGTLLALKSKASENETFNIMGAAKFAYEEAVPYAAKLLGQEHLTIEVPHYLSYEVDTSKARGYLGFSPKYDVFQMMDDSVKSLKGQDVGVIPSGFKP